MAEEPGQVRDQIEETRAEMTETVDAIQERLSPAYIKEEVKQAVTESARETKDRMQGAVAEKTQAAGQGMYQTIRANPVPAAMVGVGLGWMALNVGGSRQGNHSTAWRSESSSDGGLLGGAPRRIAETGEQATQQVREATEAVQTQATDLGYEAQAQVRRAATALERLLEENPLALGAAAVAAGIAVGMFVPESRREQELLGDARAAIQDQIAERAEQLSDKAEQVMHAVQETATDEGNSAGLHAGG